MKTLQTLLFFILIMMFTCCGNSQKTKNDSNLSANAIEQENKFENSKKDLIVQLESQLNKTESPLEKIKLLYQIAEEKAQTLSLDEFALYFDHFQKQIDATLEEINENNTDDLEQLTTHFSNRYDDNINEAVTPETIESLMKKYADIGLEPVHIGEGTYNFKLIDNFLIKKFSKHLTPQIKDSLKLRENKGKVIQDAALLISEKDFADLILAHEAFIAQYPASQLLQQVKDNYVFYQLIYLTGMDNWERIDRNGHLTPEAKRELSRFVKENPQSKTAELAKEILTEKEKDIQKLEQWIKNQH